MLILFLSGKSHNFSLLFCRFVLYLSYDVGAKRYFAPDIGKEYTTMTVNESAENYLETILMLSKKKPVVRAVDIAESLGFKKSSVSVAMKNLREKNHITVTKEGFIYLTDSGREIAEMIYERHELISNWLIRLGVNEITACEDACRMEHVISKESFEAIKAHIK